MIYDVTINGHEYRIELARGEHPGGWLCRVARQGKRLSEHELDCVAPEPGILSLILEGKSLDVKQNLTATGVQIIIGSRRYDAEVRDPRSRQSRKIGAADHEGPRKLVAPMPGKVIRILVSAGTAVEMGQSILVIEAMKMQNELKSPKKGVIQKILVSEGTLANAGDALAIVE